MGSKISTAHIIGFYEPASEPSYNVCLWENMHCFQAENSLSGTANM